MEPLKIGVSARLLYPDPSRSFLPSKSLQYLEQSVANWIKRHADSLPDQPPEPEVQTLEVNALDELLTFIGDKKTKSTS